MVTKKSNYETLLAEYSNCHEAIALLREHRPYLEMLPSLRRPDESLIPIPLPLARIRRDKGYETVSIPTDLVLLMCDPEWKVKLGVEIILLIHRPQEDFSDLLSRWRQTQILLSQEYEWIMPHHLAHIFSEGAEKIYPLFVVCEDTLPRIKQGLTGADLPFVTIDFDQAATATTLEDSLLLSDEIL
ncbi:MAG: hypothetical protein D6756_08505 [Cyanobacteria bacterium J083]|nr:MAG: hypothetical protein D6756_08505 [Cyanobacteria bacterium J083]